MKYDISRFTLGTAQLGMPYGIANRTAPPDDALARNMVQAALDGGVTTFDTAAVYGRSEEVLGRALRGLGVADRVVVMTKVRPLEDKELSNPALGAAAVEQSVAESQHRLGLDCLPIVLFHREADVRYFDVLERLRQSGHIGLIGVSCECRPGRACDFAADQRVDALQLPASVLDRLYADRGVFRIAQERASVVFVRSVFLQGLLLVPERQIPETLHSVIPARRKLTHIAREAGFGMAELAVRYMLSVPGVTSVLTGAETVEQVRQNLDVFSRGALPADVKTAVERIVPNLPEAVLNPACW